MKFIRDLISEKRSAKQSDVSIPPTVWDEETSVVPEPVEILPAEAPDVLALTPQDEVAQDVAALDEGFDSEEALADDAVLDDEIDEDFEQDLEDAAFAEDEDGYELPSPEFDATEDEAMSDEAEFEAFSEEEPFEEALDEAEGMVEAEMPEEDAVEPFERRKLWTSLRDENYAAEAEEPFIVPAEPVDETAQAIAALDLSKPAPVAQADDSLDLSGLPFINVASAEPAADAGLEVPTPSAGRGSGRSGRVKTRLLGFNPGGLAPASPFEKAAAPVDTSFPVGWMVVVSGPGRGASFPLYDGVAKIGRGEDQAIALNFGDSAISRENHAAVAYDSEANAFFIGQSGKANLVRLNNKPLLSTEQIRSGDQVRLGETTLRFVALCGEDFSWDAASQKDVKHAG
ncbi:FHA domain-containing protein [Sinirhodobacter sp. WL0062]|uniref:FHA domain-containing protein n=1 Tax=Rhodobacter flavimaris TaxID=2907145 RepID=A0ABS8Z233_9RHOB|nr:FHA domain-containing protein [Sinirhodobacter sp. WL0062]MCE5975111.1 FHA domain-containing protein [Sinirhodobacter sp. WL0062]